MKKITHEEIVTEFKEMADHLRIEAIQSRTPEYHKESKRREAIYREAIRRLEATASLFADRPEENLWKKRAARRRGRRK